MPLQLESLVFDVQTDKLKQAKDAIDALAKSMGNLNDAQQDEAASAIKAEKVKQAQLDTAKKELQLKQAEEKASKTKTKSVEEETEATKKNVSVLERQQTILDYMTQGFSKGQSSVLAYAKASGALGDELKQLESVLQVQRKLMGSDPFDKSMSGLIALKNQYGEIREAMRQYNSDMDLTRNQTRELARDKERIIEKMKLEGSSFTDIKNAIRGYNQIYTEQASKVNALIKVEKDRERSARDTANAVRNVQAAEERLFATVDNLNSELGQNSALSERAALAIGSYERNLRLAGITGEQAAAKLQKFKAAQAVITAQEEKRQTAYLTRALIPQASDIFVGLTTGMNPLTVMLQQLPQIQDLFTLTGVKASETANVISSAMTEMFSRLQGTAVAVGAAMLRVFENIGTEVLFLDKQMQALNTGRAFVSKFTGESSIATKSFDALAVVIRSTAALAGGVLVGGFASATIALIQTVKANNAATKALYEYGAATGLTRDELISLANASASYGTSSNEIKGFFGELIKGGVKSKEVLQSAADGAVYFRAVTGESLEDISKRYVELGKDPVKSLTSLAKNTGLVSVETIKTIESLLEQGLVLEANTLATESYSKALKQLAKDQYDALTPLEQLWISVKIAGGGAWQSILDFANSAPIINGLKGIALAGLAIITVLREIGQTSISAFKVLSNPFNAGATWEDWKAQINIIRTDAAKMRDDILFGNQSVNASERNLEAERAAAHEKEKERAKETQKLRDELAKAAESGMTKEQRKVIETAKIHELYRKNIIAAGTDEQKMLAVAKDYELALAGVNRETEKSSSVTKQKDETQSYYNKTLERFLDLRIQATKAEDDGVKPIELTTKSYALLQDILNDPMWAKLAPQKQSQILLEWEENNALEVKNLLYKEQKKALESLQKVWDKFNLERMKEQDAISQANEDLKFQFSILGKSENAVRKMTIAYEEHKKINKINLDYRIKELKLIQDVQHEIDGISDPAKKLEQERKLQSALIEMDKDRVLEIQNAQEESNLKVMQHYVSIWKEIQGGISNALYIGLTKGGKEAAAAIRALIEEQLKKRFIMPAIDVVVNFIVSGVTNLAGSVLGAVAGAFGVSSDSWLGKAIGLAGGAGGLGLVSKVLGKSTEGGSGSKIVDGIADAIDKALPSATQYDSMVAGYNLTTESAINAMSAYSESAIAMGKESVKYIEEASELLQSSLPDVVAKGEELMLKGIEMGNQAFEYEEVAKSIAKGNQIAIDGFAKSAFRYVAETKFGEALGFSKEISAGVFQLTDIGETWGGSLKSIGGFVEDAAPYFDAIIKLTQGDVKDAAVSAAVTWALSQIGGEFVPYAGALLKLLEGDWESAIATAALTYAGGAIGGAIGASAGSAAGSWAGPIGAAIGAILGSFIKFGGGEIYKQAIVSAGSVYKGKEGSDSWGIELKRVAPKGMDAMISLLEVYNQRAAALLGVFDVDATGMRTTAYMRQRRSSHTTAASLNVERTDTDTGAPSSTQFFGKFYASHGNPLEAFSEFAADILGEGLGLAIKAFELPENIQKMFSSVVGNDAWDKVFQQVMRLDALLTVLGSGLNEFIGDIDFAALSKEGEVGFDAVGRILQEVLSLNSVFQTLNFTLFELTANGVRGTLLFKELLGGSEESEKILNEYYNNFFSQEEKRLNTIKSIEQQLVMAGADASMLNLAEMTRLQYRQLVESTIAAKGATDPLVIALIKLSSVFASVTEEVESATKSDEERLAKLRSNTDELYSIFTRLANEQIEILKGTFKETDAALAALRKAIDAEKKIKSDEISNLEKRTAEYSKVISGLSASIESLRKSTTSTAAMLDAEAKRIIASALVGNSIDSEVLLNAASTRKSTVEGTLYSTKVEKDRAFIILSNELELIKDTATIAKTADEIKIETLKKQLEDLDLIYVEAEKQVNVLRGIDVSVISVDQAVRNLHTKIAEETGARQQIALIRSQLDTAKLQYDELRGINQGISNLPKAFDDFKKALEAEQRAKAPPRAAAAYSVNDTPAERQAKVEYQTGQVLSPSDSKELAAAKVLYQSVTGGANSAQFNAALKAIGGSFSNIGWDGSREGAASLVVKYGGSLPSYDVGANRILNDQLAMIHKDEAIIPAKFNPWAGGTLPVDNSELAEAIVELRNELNMLRYEARATATNTAKMAKQLDRTSGEQDTLKVQIVTP